LPLHILRGHGVYDDEERVEIQKYLTIKLITLCASVVSELCMLVWTVIHTLCHRCHKLVLIRSEYLCSMFAVAFFNTWSPFWSFYFAIDTNVHAFLFL